MSMNSMIRNIIDDDVLYGFNYEGKLNKHRLRDYTIFSKHLKDMWDPTGECYKDFIKDLGHCIRLSHLRIYKKNAKIRKTE